MKPARHKLSLSDVLAAQLTSVGIQGWIRELPAVPGRRFRIDIAFPEHKLAIECQGGVWTGGRHTSGAGFTNECEKACLLAIQGWRYFPVTGQQIKRGTALQWIEKALRGVPR